MIKWVSTFIVAIVNKAASRVVSNLERQANEQNIHARDLKETKSEDGVCSKVSRDACILLVCETTRDAVLFTTATINVPTHLII